MKVAFFRAVTMALLKTLLIAAMALGAPGALMAQAQSATQPNIVVVMTDDQTLESLRVMSKTRRLIGGAGTTFRNSFASFPLCCPSRATFLTGQYAHNHGVVGNAPPAGGYTKLNNANTLPLWLQEAGYYTSYIGKYLNGYPPATNKTLVPPGWNDWQGLFGGAQLYNYAINDNGALVRYGTATADYQTDVLARRATTTINEAVLRQPFFLGIGTKAPHGEESVAGFPNPRPARRHLNAFAGEPLPRPPSFNESNVTDKPAFIRNMRPITTSEAAAITAAYRSELGSLLAVDDLVESVVRALTNAGVLNKTVIVFTSDNGFFHGEQRIRTGKVRVYEPSVRVPLLIRGIGFPQGETADQVVANIDLAPTIVALAGATPRRVMDGRSLLPLAQTPNLATARDILIETKGYKAVRNQLIETKGYKAVRSQSFLYVEHDSGERELYDFREGTVNYDPYQLNSRHLDGAYTQIMAQLAVRLDQLSVCSGTSCRAQ